MDIYQEFLFTMNLIDPCPTSTLVLDSENEGGTDPWDYDTSFTYVLRDPAYTWQWIGDLAINDSTQVDCGASLRAISLQRQHLPVGLDFV